MRSTEPLLSTHLLTEPRKGDRFCVVLQWKEMLLVLDLCCDARKEMPMTIECVLFCNVRKCRKMLDVGCVAPDEMPMDIECVFCFAM